MSNHATVNSADQKRIAIKELTKGLDMVTELWCLLDQQSSPLTKLCDEIIANVDRGISLLTTSPDTARHLKENQGILPKHLKMKRTSRSENDIRIRMNKNTEKVVFTDSPFSGLYQWKKYGEKPIRNRKYPRCYYQCKSDKCNGKIRVQQIDCSEFPKYEVITASEHTCDMISEHSPMLSHRNDDPVLESSRFEQTFDGGILSSGTGHAWSANNEPLQLHSLDFSLDDQAIIELSSFLS